MDLQGLKIIVNGIFTEYNGTTANRIIRLNNTGSNDTSFVSGTGFSGSIGITDTVNTAIESGGSRIVVVGNFTSYDGITHNRIVKLLEDGQEDVFFDSSTGFNDTARTVTIESGSNKIYVGGFFTEYSGSSAVRFVRINPSGSIDSTYSAFSGLNSNCLGVTLQSDNKAIIAGNFTTVNSVTSNRIARLNTDGTLDTSFNVGNGFNLFSREVVVEPGTQKVLIGGTFTTYSGSNANRIVKVNTNGTIDPTFNFGTGFNQPVNSISQTSNGDFLIGGGFTSYNGSTVGRLVRVNSSGSLNTTFNANLGTGFNNTVFKVKEEVNGSIIAVGSFTEVSGSCFNRIVRLTNSGSIITLADPCPTPTPTPTPTSTPIPTSTPTATPTSTPLPPTATPTPTPTVTATPTPLPPTATPTPTPTATATPTPVPPTATPTPTPALGACCDSINETCSDELEVNCIGPGLTFHPGEECISFICPPPATPTPTPTPTTVPPTATPTPTPTPTTAPPTPTPTVTPTPTAVPPTATPTPTPTGVPPTATPTPTPTTVPPTATPTPTLTSTPTPSPTAVPPTATPTPTPSPTPTPALGACCDSINETCTDEFEVDCTGPGLTFHPGEECISFICPL